MPEFDLQAIDLIVIGVYIAAIVGIGFWVGRGTEDSDSFFLAGRGMSWPLVGFSLIVTNFSGTQFLGLAGAGYDTGIMVWNYEWMATLILLVFAVLILPIYLQSKITTVPEYMELRYDRRSRYVFSGFTVFTGMLIDTAGAMFAGAIVLQLLFPGIPLMVNIIIIALLGGGYVIVGGLKAVMITDTIQGVLLLIASAVIFLMAFSRFDFDWGVFAEMAPENGFTVAPPPSDDFLPWPGIFTGAIWLGFYVWVTNHIVVQRVLAAKNLDHGRWGALFAGFMQLPWLILLIFPGILARGILPDIDDSNHVWPALIFEVLPIGIRGLVAAALLAALMSTLDSVLNGAASLIINDFVKLRDKEYSQERLLVLSRVTVGVLMVVAALWAPVITTFDNLVAYFQSFLGYVTMPIVVVLLGGIFWKRGSAQAAFLTMLIGLPVGLVGFATGELFELHNVQFLYGTGIMLLFSAVLFVVITLATRAPEPASIREVTFDRNTWRNESAELADKPWYANYRYISLAILIATIAAVVPFI